MNATTVAGNGSSVNLTLECPAGITLDADSNLFIVDNIKHRVVSVVAGVGECIFGCTGVGSTMDRFEFPWSLAFDSRGNLFVTDGNNKRMQKFQLVDRGQCGE